MKELDKFYICSNIYKIIILFCILIILICMVLSMSQAKIALN